MGQQAIDALAGHEERCLVATRETKEELTRLWEQTENNHRDFMGSLNTSISGVHRNVDAKFMTLGDAVDGVKNKEVRLYRWLIPILGASLVALVLYIWSNGM